MAIPKRAATLLVLLLLGCSSAKVKPTVSVELLSQELTVAEQGTTEFRLRLKGKLESREAFTIERAFYELVVDENVVKTGEAMLQISSAPGEITEFLVERSAHYASTPEELKALSARGGTILAALRGKVLVQLDHRTIELPFARSRDVRVPRLPKTKLLELDAARYSADEAKVVFYLGVENPNPFTIRMSGLSYRVTLAAKELESGTLGQGEKIAPSSTGMFEVHATLSPQTYGPGVAKLIKSQVIPYVIKGSFAGDLIQEPYELSGTFKLNVSK